MKEKREVDFQFAKDFAEKINFSYYFECSAKEGINIEEIFLIPTSDYLDKLFNHNINNKENNKEKNEC